MKFSESSKAYILVFVIVTLTSVSILMAAVIQSVHSSLRIKQRYIIKREMLLYLENHNKYLLDTFTHTNSADINDFNYNFENLTINTRIFVSKDLKKITDFTIKKSKSYLAISNMIFTNYLQNLNADSLIYAESVISNHKMHLKMINLFTIRPNKTNIFRFFSDY